MIRKRLKKIVLFCFLWFLIHTSIISYDGLNNNLTQADVAIVLGNKVNEDGSISVRLEKRLECGLDLFKNGKVKKLIVSGGKGKEGHFEADKMKEYYMKNGISDSLILVDNGGYNTRATVRNTSQFLTKESKIIVVSQYYHVSRTKMLYKKAGFKSVQGLSPMYFELHDFYSILREFVAFYTQLL